MSQLPQAATAALTLEAVAPHLLRDWDYTANTALGLDPATISARSAAKAHWTCAECGHCWQTTVRKRAVDGKGCKECFYRRLTRPSDPSLALANTHPEVVGEWDYETNSPLTPLDVMPGSSRRVGWICSRSHRWNAKVSNRSVRGQGCPFCSGQKPIPGETDLPSTRPDLVAQIHPDSGVDPTQLMSGSRARVLWMCPTEPRHDPWWASVARRSSGDGCPTCRGILPWVGHTDLATISPWLAPEWDYEANGDLTPQGVTAGSSRRVGWRCVSCTHRWRAVVSDRVRYRLGCPACGRSERGRYKAPAIAGVNDLLTAAPPAVMAEWDYELNSDHDPSLLSCGSNQKVFWRCTAWGHSWRASVTSRALSQTGCPVCAGRTVLRGFNDFHSQADERLVQEWDDEMNTIHPWEVTLGSSRQVAWRCSDCGQRWRAPVARRTGGNGSCDRCCKNHTSIVERAMFEALSPRLLGPEQSAVIEDAIWVTGRQANRARVDIFGRTATGARLAAEYDGEYFHSKADSEYRDTAKTTALLDAGYFVVRVRENGLPHLDTQHPRLLQLSFAYRPVDPGEQRSRMEPIAEEVEAWLSAVAPKNLQPDHLLRA